METNQTILQIKTAGELIADFKTAMQEVLQNNPTTTKSQDGEQLLTRDEVCEMLNINKSTLWKHTKKGKLKSYGIGRRVFYKRKEVIDSIIPLRK